MKSTTKEFSNYLGRVGVGNGADYDVSDYDVSEIGTSKMFGSSRDFPR